MKITVIILTFNEINERNGSRKNDFKNMSLQNRHRLYMGIPEQAYYTHIVK